MNNNEKQYKRTGSRYTNEVVDYAPEMTVSRNAYSSEDYYNAPVKRRASTADFEKMIDTSVDTSARYSDDLFPSSTTMQFRGDEREHLYIDMNKREEQIEREDEEASYKINTKGKIMIAVYALVVLTIFTLIIMNTRLIKDMNASITEQEAQISLMKQENADLADELGYVSSDEAIIERAEEMGMVKGND